MAKWASIDNGVLNAIAHHEFVGAVPIPDELQDKSLADLLVESKIRNGQIVPRKCKAGKLRVALVSNWKMRCGIATYANCLYEQLVPHLSGFKLFVERNNNPTEPMHQLGDTILTNDQIVECWTRGEPLDELIAAIKDYDPDVVLIQMEYGIFPNARYWLSLMTQLSDYRTITTLHSIFPHHLDKLVVEASIKEMVVHLDGAKQALLDKGVNGKVSVIPHGCYSADQTRLWNVYRSEHTFLNLGFLLRYKFIEMGIKAAYLLQDEFPDVYFTAVCSETDFNAAEHTAYYNELMVLIDQLGLVNHVGLIRGFQSDQAVSAYMRTNTACLLPYASNPAHEVYGASGAARLAMAHGIPVITSTFHHFDDIPTIKADGEEATAEALAALFRSKDARKTQVEKQNAHIATNGWAETAKRYIELFNS